MIQSLKYSDNFWAILALDHGLTDRADAVSLSMITTLLETCNDYFSATVATYGLARSFRGQIKKPLILQCFGAPKGKPKIKIADVDAATRINANAISVQIDFSLSHADFNAQLGEISRLTCEAHTKEIPVLFMVSSEQSETFEKIANKIRFCQEIGADLVKIRCNILSLKQGDSDYYRNLLKLSPPVLLSGGAGNDKLQSELNLAKKVGFSGYCIGRSVYQSTNPRGLACELVDNWVN